METTAFLNSTLCCIYCQIDIPAALKSALGYAYPKWDKKAA